MKPSSLAMTALATLSLAVLASRSSGFFQPAQGPYLYTEAREAVRCVLFTSAGVGASYSIDYGVPDWKPEYDQKFDDMTLGKRMRFGKDHWAELDCNAPLMINDKEVKAGLYDLAFERNKKGEFSLVLLDPSDLRKSRIDPSATEQTKGGQLVPLKIEKSDASAPKLKLELKQEGKSEQEQNLTIDFGAHRLTAHIKVKG